jgi:hypothetical protein
VPDVKRLIWAITKYAPTSLNFMTENQVPTAPSGHPIRNKCGGRLAQLQEISDLISEGLVWKITGAGGKRSWQLDNVPESLPDNDMAPPTKAKRQRLNKVTLETLP